MNAITVTVKMSMLSTAYHSHNLDIVLAGDPYLLRTVRCRYYTSGLEGIPSHDCTLQKLT